ncbi:hypothetical protein SBS95_04230, partial [Klebsiella pneumoniae]|nr:hypothetical protein [Klebsiella pneumoniae]
GTVCVVGKMRDLILQLSKSSIYSTNPMQTPNPRNLARNEMSDWLIGKFGLVNLHRIRGE